MSVLHTVVTTIATLASHTAQHQTLTTRAPLQSLMVTTVSPDTHQASQASQVRADQRQASQAHADSLY